MSTPENHGYDRTLFASINESRSTRVAFGVLVKFGGQVRITDLLSVVGFPAGSDFAVGNVPTVAASAALAAVGAAVLPAVVLDGSVVQRVA